MVCAAIHRAECIESKSEKKSVAAVVVTVVGGHTVGRLVERSRESRKKKRGRRETKERAATPGAILLEFK